jgi:hypothetical protein
MPNHVTNELIFAGIDPAVQDAIIAKICDTKGAVDFSILIPMPINIWRGNVGQRHEKAFKLTALDWCTDQWGTKWNAYNSREIRRTEDALTITFDTAWSPPYPWLAAVFNTFERSFEHNWFDEGAEWSVEGRFNAAALADILSDPWKEDRASQEVHERLHTLKYGCAAFEDEQA